MDPSFVSRLLVALLLAGAAYAVSRRFRLLSSGGAAAAALLAAVLLGCGGWGALLPVVFFFLSSSALSRVGDRIVPDTEGRFAKGSERDAMQVAANGGVAALAAIAMAAGGGERWQAALLGATAAATADTWGTEIGMLSGAPARLLPSLRKAPRGTSGAVSLPGLVASCAGAVVIAAIGLPFVASGGNSLPLVVAIAGVVGALVDSMLGALLQAKFRCVRCGRDTERSVHCDAPAASVGGWAWVTNDAVNLACTLAGALSAYVLAGTIIRGALSP